MKKVFIDGGAHNGESVEYFYQTFPDAEQYEVHSFEPNPELWSLIEKKKTILHKYAMWDKDSETDFWKSRFHTEGGTILTKKITGKVDYNNPIKVNTIDFSNWMKENLNKDDYIVLKLDIEGAEYTVLEKMYRDGTLTWINEFWGEFHLPNRIKSLDEGIYDRIQGYLKEVKLDFKDWHVSLVENELTNE